MKNKTTCQLCGKTLGVQGLSIHMKFKHPNVGKEASSPAPGSHPVEELEIVISKLVQREISLVFELNQRIEIQGELTALAALRAKLEEMVDSYKSKKEGLIREAYAEGRGVEAAI